MKQTEDNQGFDITANTDKYNDCMQTKFRIAYILSVKKVESTLLLIVAAFALCIGFLIGNTEGNNNYELIFQFGNKYFWVSFFVAYALTKLLSLVKDVDYRAMVVNSVLGLWAWLYIFLSFTVFDTTDIAPTEALLVMPIITEAWLLLSYRHNKKDEGIVCS